MSYVGSPQQSFACGTSSPSGTTQVGSPGQLQKMSKLFAPPPQPATPALSSRELHTQPSMNKSYDPRMILKPESVEISIEQLAAEVKAIYSTLVILERKCIETDSEARKLIEEGKALGDEQLKAMITLHRKLMNEHHDFLLASQHPSGSPALKRLASKYCMQARMWQHSIHSFLEVLRHSLPSSHEFMLSFINTAYNMMTLLYEIVPIFQTCWVEWLGDVARYRMAIEEDTEEREIWSNISKRWYTMTLDRTPETGRLMHHLAILARPNHIQALSFFFCSLTSFTPFKPAYESIGVAFLSKEHMGWTSMLPNELTTSFVAFHLSLLRGESAIQTSQQSEVFKHNFTSTMQDVYEGHWPSHGAWMALTNITAILGHGKQTSMLFSAFQRRYQGFKSEVSTETTSGDEEMSVQSAGNIQACQITMVMFQQFLTSTNFCFGPYVHIIFLFIYSVTSFQAGPQEAKERDGILDKVPWDSVCFYLNTISRKQGTQDQSIWKGNIWTLGQEKVSLLEDRFLRGQIWTQITPTESGKGNYFPEEWSVEEDTRFDSRTSEKKAFRILHLGYRLALISKFISYNEVTNRWSTETPGVATSFNFPNSQNWEHWGSNQQVALAKSAAMTDSLAVLET